MKNFKPRGHFSEILENDTILGERYTHVDALTKPQCLRATL